MQIFDVVIDSEDVVKIVSFVEKPALEEEWVLLSAEEDTAIYSDNKDNISEIDIVPQVESLKRIVTAPILIPDKLIYRKKGHYLRFPQSTIDKVRDIFIKSVDKYINFNHNGKTVDSAELIEFYQTSENVKNEMFPNVPIGSLFASYKILSEELFQEVLSGKYNGFSIEILGKLLEEITLNYESEMENIDKEKEPEVQLESLEDVVTEVQPEAIVEEEEVIEEKVEVLKLEDIKSMMIAVLESYGFSPKSEVVELSSEVQPDYASKIAELESKLVELQAEVDADSASKIKTKQVASQFTKAELALQFLKNK